MGFCHTVAAWAGIPCWVTSWRSLSARQLGMDVPVALALVLAWGASCFNSLRGTGEVYFDSVTMFTFLLLLGRFAEMTARHSGGSTSDALLHLQPISAVRLRDGASERVAVAELCVGDVVLVPVGEAFPTDGFLVSDSASVDESMLTGESAAVVRAAGERVLGGSINVGEPARIAVWVSFYLNFGPIGLAAGTVLLGWLSRKIYNAYVRDPANLCETAAMMGRPSSQGAMGVHYFRPDLLGITAPPSPRVNTGNGVYTDFNAPAILIYEPQRDGSMELVAVENLVFMEAWRAHGHSSPPTFHGVPYDRMVDDPNTSLDEAHNFEAHYDRHVWIYRRNPRGMFQPFNPAVSCAHHERAGHSMH